jgi:hypothetical protein
VPSTGVWIARFRFVRRGPAFQAAQRPYSPSAGNGMAPLAAVSAQGTLPYRPQVFGERGVVSCDTTWASFSSRSRVLQPKRRQRHGALRCSNRARRAAAPSSGVWRAWSRIVRRGPELQAALGLFRPSTGMAPFSVVSEQDSQPRRHSSFGGAVSLHATWASFSSCLRALQTQRRQRHGAPRCSKRVRHASKLPQVFGERVVASCDVGQLFKPLKGFSAQAPVSAWHPSLQ